MYVILIDSRWFSDVLRREGTPCDFRWYVYVHTYVCILNTTYITVIMYYHSNIGIHILPPSPEKEEYLPYAWLPVSRESKSFNEIGICDHQAEYRHVRVCEAELNTDLAEVVACKEIMDDEDMEMLLVINHDNSYTIPNLLDDKWLWPVAIVTAHSGIRLKHILCQHPDDTKMNVLLDSPHGMYSTPTQVKKKVSCSAIFSEMFVCGCTH